MNPNSISIFKKKLAEKCTVGLFSKTCDSSIVETFGKGGFDFCILDMEHGPVSYETLPDLIRACECSGILPIVRVAYNSEEYISKALDLGACGVQIPQINSRFSAEKAIEYSRFHPLGHRGVCRYVRAAGYSSQNRYDYFCDANQALIILQIEGIEGIKNIDEILSVPGIDILFLGPYDLSQSIGFPGDVHHEKVIAHMKSIIKKAADTGIAVGTFVDTPEEGRYWKSLGVKYIANSVDVGILYSACKAITDRIRE